MPVVFGGGNCDVAQGKVTKFRAPLKGGYLNLYFHWDKALPNMLTEKDLLTDIIANTPSGSIWNITEDSWESIPEVLSEYQIPYRGDGWDIEISASNREDVIKRIEEFEIYGKIVHQRLFWQGELLFVSYDRMTGSYIRRDFPSFSVLLEKYSDCEFYLGEQFD